MASKTKHPTLTPTHKKNSGWKSAQGLRLKRLRSLFTDERRTTSGRVCVVQSAHAAVSQCGFAIVHNTWQGAATAFVYSKEIQMKLAPSGDLARVAMLNSIKRALVGKARESCQKWLRMSQRRAPTA